MQFTLGQAIQSIFFSMLVQFTSKRKVPFLSFVGFLNLFTTIFRVYFFPNGITFHKVKITQYKSMK